MGPAGQPLFCTGFICMSFIFDINCVWVCLGVCVSRVYVSTCSVLASAPQNKNEVYNTYILYVHEPRHSLCLFLTHTLNLLPCVSLLSISFSPHNNFSCRFVIKLNRPVFLTVLASFFVVVALN